MPITSAPRSPTAGPGRRRARTEQMDGPRLIAWMQEFGYSGAALARELGVTERTVFRWRASDSLAPLYLTLAIETLTDRHRRRKGPA